MGDLYVVLASPGDLLGERRLGFLLRKYRPTDIGIVEVSREGGIPPASEESVEKMKKTVAQLEERMGLTEVAGKLRGRPDYIQVCVNRYQKRNPSCVIQKIPLIDLQPLDFDSTAFMRTANTFLDDMVKDKELEQAIKEESIPYTKNPRRYFIKLTDGCYKTVKELSSEAFELLSSLSQNGMGTREEEKAFGYLGACVRMVLGMQTLESLSQSINRFYSSHPNSRTLIIDPIIFHYQVLSRLNCLNHGLFMLNEYRRINFSEQGV